MQNINVKDEQVNGLCLEKYLRNGNVRRRWKERGWVEVRVGEKL